MKMHHKWVKNLDLTVPLLKLLELRCALARGKSSTLYSL